MNRLMHRQKISQLRLYRGVSMGRSQNNPLRVLTEKERQDRRYAVGGLRAFTRSPLRRSKTTLMKWQRTYQMPH